MGSASTILVDKRLVYRSEIDHYVELARTTGRKLRLIDIDAPLEMSLYGVLMRKVGGGEAIPPADIIAEGFTMARAHRTDVISRFVTDPSLGTYELHVTRPDGSKVKVAEVIDGQVRAIDEDLFYEALQDPADAAERILDQTIDDALVAELTRALAPEFADKVRAALRPYRGRTWREAITAHGAASGGTP
jgi:hypothetical protein